MPDSILHDLPVPSPAPVYGTQLLARIEHKLDAVLALKRHHRLRLTAETKRQHLETVCRSYFGRCPCCMDAAIIVDGRRAEHACFDHYSDNPSKSRAFETWLICGPCNQAFASGKLDRAEQSHKFHAFQQERRKIERRRQLKLI